MTDPRTPSDTAGAQKFRKKPVVIEAIRLTRDLRAAELHAFLGTLDGVHVEPLDGIVLIDTLEGVMKANLGDWIIRGVKGELYPCKPDIFEATYEPAAAQLDTPNEELEKLLEEYASGLGVGRTTPIEDCFCTMCEQLRTKAIPVRAAISQLFAASLAQAEAERDGAARLGTDFMLQRDAALARIDTARRNLDNGNDCFDTLEEAVEATNRSTVLLRNQMREYEASARQSVETTPLQVTREDARRLMTLLPNIDMPRDVDDFLVDLASRISRSLSGEPTPGETLTPVRYVLLNTSSTYDQFIGLFEEIENAKAEAEARSEGAIRWEADKDYPDFTGGFCYGRKQPSFSIIETETNESEERARAKLRRIVSGEGQGA